MTDSGSYGACREDDIEQGIDGTVTKRHYPPDRHGSAPSVPVVRVHAHRRDDDKRDVTLKTVTSRDVIDLVHKLLYRLSVVSFNQPCILHR